jgi:hypothetical protein
LAEAVGCLSLSGNTTVELLKGSAQLLCTVRFLKLGLCETEAD